MGEESLVEEAIILLGSNDDMVTERDIHNLACLEEFLSNEFIAVRRVDITAGVIMNNDKRNGLIFQVKFHNFADVDGDGVDGSIGDGDIMSNLVLGIEDKEFKDFFFEGFHSGVEVIEDVIGAMDDGERFVGLIDSAITDFKGGFEESDLFRMEALV